MPLPKQGQESDSPTDNDNDIPGQSSESLTDTEKILKAASETEDTATPVKPAKEKEEAKKEKPKEKPLPYDQDPKWKSARAAEARMQKILEDHGLDSMDDIEKMVARGESVRDLLGDKDLTKLIQDANRLKEIEAYWADQEKKRQEEGEEPEETIKRLKKENEDLQSSIKTREQTEEEVQRAQQALDRYTSTVDNIVSETGLEGDAAKMARMFLGVDNQFNEINIEDIKSVKDFARTGSKIFVDFIAKVKQDAVDEYAKGMSNITPISPSGETAEKKVARKPIDPSAGVDKVFAGAADELLEILNSEMGLN